MRRRLITTITTAIATAFATLAHAQPANDLCANAMPIANHSVTPWDTTGATIDGTLTCGATTNQQGDIWFAYTATGVEVVNVNLCGSGSRNKTLQAFWGGCNGSPLACSTNGFCGSGQHSISFATPGAGTVLICITMRGTSGSQAGLLSLDSSPPAANDTCTTPQIIPGPGAYPFDLSVATAQGPAGSCSPVVAPDLFYSYTAGPEGYISIDTFANAASGLSTNLQVFSACGGTELACNNSVQDMGGSGARICSFPVTNGATYIIRLASDTIASARAGTLTLSHPSPPAAFSPPANALNEPGICGEPLAADPNCACCPGFHTFTDINPHDVTYQGSSAQRPELGSIYSDDDAYRMTIAESDIPGTITVVGQTEFDATIQFFKTSNCSDYISFMSIFVNANCGPASFSITQPLGSAAVGEVIFQISHTNSPDDSRCGHNDRYWFHMTSSVPCAADLGVQGGVAGHDGALDNNDFVVFIDHFFNADPRADFGIQGGLPGHDGQFDNNDFVVFIDAFFDGCP